MSAFLLAVSPFIVSLVSQGVKKWVIPWISEQATVNNAWVVLAVAVVSYIGAIFTSGLNGGSLDILSTQTFVTALINFLGATGVFHLSTSTAKAVGMIK